MNEQTSSEHKAVAQIACFRVGTQISYDSSCTVKPLVPTCWTMGGKDICVMQ